MIADFMSKKEISTKIRNNYAEISVRDCLYRFSFDKKNMSVEMYVEDFGQGIVSQDQNHCETRAEFINYISEKIN